MNGQDGAEMRSKGNSHAYVKFISLILFCDCLTAVPFPTSCFALFLFAYVAAMQGQTQQKAFDTILMG